MPIIAKRLRELGIELPKPAAAVAAYVPYVVVDNLVYVSGQLPMKHGRVAVIGRVGGEIGVETGQLAARLCALNVLAQLNAACEGKMSRVARCVKLGGFIASAQDFYDQPEVMNGASELIEQVFGDLGKHTRVAVGVGCLPRNAAVEVDAIFALSRAAG